LVCPEGILGNRPGQGLIPYIACVLTLFCWASGRYGAADGSGTRSNDRSVLALTGARRSSSFRIRHAHCQDSSFNLALTATKPLHRGSSQKAITFTHQENLGALVAFAKQMFNGKRLRKLLSSFTVPTCSSRTPLISRGGMFLA